MGKFFSFSKRDLSIAEAPTRYEEWRKNRFFLESQGSPFDPTIPRSERSLRWTETVDFALPDRATISSKGSSPSLSISRIFTLTGLSIAFIPVSDANILTNGDDPTAKSGFPFMNPGTYLIFRPKSINTFGSYTIECSYMIKLNAGERCGTPDNSVRNRVKREIKREKCSNMAGQNDGRA